MRLLTVFMEEPVRMVARGGSDREASQSNRTESSDRPNATMNSLAKHADFQFVGVRYLAVFISGLLARPLL
jgi:hypothetical protein